MALAGLRVLGVLLLMNLATEIRCHSYSHPIDVTRAFGKTLDTCLSGEYSTAIEFRKIKYGSDAYMRRTVSTAVLQCIISGTVSRANEAEVLDCFKLADNRGEKYSILYFENSWCMFSSADLPESFFDCPDPASDTKVIYTHDSVRFGSREEVSSDAEPIDSCSAEIANSTAKIEVSECDSGSCKSDLYLVKFLFDGTEREETMMNNTETPFDADIPQCTLVNVTISRLMVAGMPEGSGTCQTALITNPAEAELVENENDLVLITEPCEFLQYRVELAPDSGAVYRGPFPVDGIPVSFPKAEVGSSLSIEFMSDFDIRLPKNIFHKVT